MKISKNEKTKSIIITCITLITFVELYLAYKISKEYAGVYQIGVFILPIILQPFVYNSLFRESKAYSKLRIITIGLLSLILPLIIYCTLPGYTYNQGKQTIELYEQTSKNTVFIDIYKNKQTVPLVDNSERLLIYPKAYYYGIKSTVDNKYFIVSPLTGEIILLSEDFYLGLKN